MTSSHLIDQKPREDPVEALRLLVGELRQLVVRLELRESTPDPQAALKRAQERLCGPRAVVMLLSEHADLKRRFLERLLGPIALVPNPTTVCTRLEYGAEIECEAETPPQTMRAILLPNPTLKGGLAVIDTPVLESAEPPANVLECAEQADAWILVLHADHTLGEASQALLRRLPERGARLEIVVEDADALSSGERLTARELLMQTLCERCNIEAPRLTLVASAATEGDEESFWHGRFATFHSVMMLRGREHWMEGTRAMVLDALSQVGAQIELELNSFAPGVRHARLRLGMTDLDGLRTRFCELPVSEVGSPDAAAESTVAPMTDPALAGWSGLAAKARPKRGLSVNLSGDLRRLVPQRERSGKVKLLRVAGVAVAIVFVCLILWALAPRGSLFAHEPAAEWDYRQPQPAPPSHIASVSTAGVGAPALPQPGNAAAVPDPAKAPTPDIAAAPVAKHRRPIRMPLVHPIPSDATAGVARSTKRHHRHLLGLDKVWRWVRHPHHGKSDQNNE